MGAAVVGYTIHPPKRKRAARVAISLYIFIHHLLDPIYIPIKI